MKKLLSHNDVMHAAASVAHIFITLAETHCPLKVFPIPRGGVPALYAVLTMLSRRIKIEIVSDPLMAHVFVDDLEDSGRTKSRYQELNKEAVFLSLFVKGSCCDWYVFPWEGTDEKSIEENFVRLIQYCGEDVHRGGLLETPARMAKAWSFWTSGYGKSPIDVLKTFEDGGELYDEMIHVRNIPFYSQCEHHMAPFFGTVTFAYIPDKRIVGLSKMDRLVDIFARRLQVQERLTQQIIDSFCDSIFPLGAGIMVRARHLCMESRGVCHQGSETTTSAFRGVLKSKPEARAEFFSLASN